MNLRTHRLRRVAAAAALGVGTVGGVVGFAVGGSAGASTFTGATIHASSAPTVASTGSGQKAGTLTLTLPATGTGGTVDLTVAATAAKDVKWTGESVKSSGGTASATVTAGTASKLVVTAAKATGTAETITITGITYTTTGAHGTVTVTPTSAKYAFKPASVVNAVAPAKAPTPPAATTLTAPTGAAKVIPDKTGQSANNWLISIKGAKGTAWTKTSVVTVTVFTPTGTNCSTSHGYVLFTGTPTATVTSTTDTSTTPKVTTATSHGTDCAVSSDHNQLTVAFGNTGTFTATTGTITIVVSGIKYNVGNKTTTGPIKVAYIKVNGTKVAASTAPANADVTTLYVSANTPVVHVAKKAFDAAISPVKIFSDTADAVSGYVCLSLSTGARFNPAATATAKQTGGATGKTTPKVTYQTAAGATTTKATTAAYAMFHVVTEVTKTLPVTYTVSGLKVDAATKASKVTAKDGASPKCTADTTVLGTAVAFTIATTTVEVYGSTADATAAAEFQRTFPSTKLTTTKGTKVHKSCPATRAAVIATTVVYQDALSSQFLAQDLTTGTLLTPTTSLAQVTATTLRKEGINTVYVVGGPLAITTAVANDIAALPVYKCGGTTRSKTTGTVVVHRIYGETAEGTAMSVAEFVGKAPAKAFLGAYTTPTATPNSTGGNGRYNDTAGKGSKLPSSAATLTTAILASATEFQDAQAASVLAYHTAIPMLLTSTTSLSTTAVAAINDLHVQQVILLGGQLAVTNTVEAALVAKTGVSVLRVAGKDYTDTARQLADFEANTTVGGLGLGWTVGKRVLVARGNGFTDGLAGAVLDNKNNATTGASHEHPLLLTESPTVVGPYLTTFLKIAGKTGIDGRGGTNVVKALTILGGPLAVSPAEISDMQTDLAH